MEQFEPAVDIPVQLNFGSLYSSSVTIFFDFEEEAAPGARSHEIAGASLVQ